MLVVQPFTSAADNAVDVAVRSAWIRETPPMSQALAGYLVLQNQSAQTYTLIGASGADFERVMLHKTEMQDGIARMAHQTEVKIAAGATVVFAPGGLHLMLMRPKRTLRAGDHVKLVLLFANGRRLPVDFEVRQVPPR